MEPEVLFIKYALPCSQIIKQWNEISNEEFSQLEEAAINNKVLPKEFLEKVFFRAFERIKIVAKELNKDVWHPDVIRAYFIDKHNSIIDQGQGNYALAPQTLKNLCKVQKARVLEIKGDCLIVGYGNQKRVVLNHLVPRAKVNDIVTIHYGYAIEKL